MRLSLDFIPRRPFPSFKWKWASVQCTEGINNPAKHPFPGLGQP